MPPRRTRGPRAREIGAPRAGPTATIRVLTGVIGRPCGIRLVSGTAGAVRTAPTVLAEVPGRMSRPIADTGDAAAWLRGELREQGTGVVIPGTRDRKIRLDTRRDRDRWRVEAIFCRLRDFRRIATRSHAPARHFASTLALDALVAV